MGYWLKFLSPLRVRSGGWRGGGVFWRGDTLLIVYSKQHVVTEAVPSMRLLPFPREIHLRGLGQPKIYISFAEFYRAVLDRGVLGKQTDLRHRRQQVRFHSYDLVGVRRNPGAAL